MDDLLWLSVTDKGHILRIKVVPNSSKNQWVGLFGDRLRLKITAPPVDGKANEAVIKFLAETLKIKSQQIQLLRGITSSSKDFLITGVNSPVFENFKKSFLSVGPAD